MRHLLMEHRNGLLVHMELTGPDGYAERGAAVAMLDRLPARCAKRRRRTPGALRPRLRRRDWQRLQWPTAALGRNRGSPS
jgi:hypothetical protein